MAKYLFRRVLLLVPTLIGIITLNFFIVQMAPGGPVDQMIAALTGQDTGGATSRVAGAQSGSRQTDASTSAQSQYAGAQGLDPELIEAIERQFGFDKPLHVRYFKMIGDYLTLDLGESYFEGRPVIDLIVERFPVSISLGLWSMLLIYLISIPLGVAKAVRDGGKFDAWTSGVIFVGYAVPGFLFAVFLIVLFAGGAYLDLFPLRGLTSNNFDELSFGGKIIDYFWHLALPVVALTIGGFATLTMLTKNSFLDEIAKQYVLTARAKGLDEQRVLYGHVFRNAMLIVIAGFPAALVGILFTGALLIEVIFSLDGLGLLGFDAVLRRDYPIIFGTLFVFTFVGLVMTLVGDITYTLVDPRIDFESRST
ncbi:MAG: microcin C ABC transporter permease YejB [Gammaproteobacteria bacterium]|nr:microcin C ABC transporter permease YejB [Gammaproteobacteria bacterium]